MTVTDPAKAGAVSEAGRSVYVVDDDDLMREEIEALLSGTGYAVQSFASADALLAQVPEPAGVLIVDLRLRGTSGLLLQQKLIDNAGVQFIFVSGVAEVEDAVDAMKAGAFEFLVKPFRAQKLIDAVGGAFELLGDARTAQSDADAARRAYGTLTETERTIVPLLAQGFRNKQVAYVTGKAENTVKVHRARILHKMGVTTLVELASKLNRAGISRDSNG